jgi:hypothetical protein
MFRRLAARVPAAVWVFLLPVVLGAPFVGRAYFVDDLYHVTMARGLLEHPLRPYDFRADDAGPGNLGWEKGSFPRMVNPPLHHYLVAAFWKLTGGRLWAVRLGMLLFSGLSAVFLWRLAGRFLLPPVPAAALCVLTPAFWLSSYSLLIDSTMLTFFLGGLWAWIEGLHRRSARRLAIGGVLMGAAMLTKYTGGFVCALAALWWAMLPREERRWRDLAWLAIPTLMLAGWNVWTAAVYGAPHLTESSKRAVQSFHWGNVLAFLTFFSGVTLAPLAAWRWTWADGRNRAAAFAVAGAVLAGFLASRWGGFGPGQAALMAFLAAGSLVFFDRVVRLDFSAGPSSDRFLLAWLALGAFQLVFVMGWTAARYHLAVVPPAVFLALRAAQRAHRHFASRLNGFHATAAAALLLAGAALAVGDHLQASTQRLIREDLRRDGLPAAGGRSFYLGDTFTGGQVKDDGWEPAFPETAFRPGDVVLRREVVMPPWWFRPDPARMRLLKVYDYPSRWPVRVMDNRGAAGFYASVWGALPFTFSVGPLERYSLIGVTGGDGG